MIKLIILLMLTVNRPSPVCPFTFDAYHDDLIFKNGFECDDDDRDEECD